MSSAIKLSYTKKGKEGMCRKESLKKEKAAKGNGVSHWKKISLAVWDA